MLWVPQKGSTRVITNDGIVGTITPGTGVPSHATTLLDGAVTELISAANNNQDSWGINIQILETGAAATPSEACMDILIGGATDDILIAALICGSSLDNSLAGLGHSYFFPIHIPQGKRIAASLASVRTSITSRVIVHLYGDSPPPFRVGSRVVTYGTQINNARGKAVVPATSGGAASVTEMTASSTYDHFAFLPGFQPATDTTLAASRMFNIGIGVGAATEYRIGTWIYKTNSSEGIDGPRPFLPAFQDVPAGTRLSLLASNANSNDAAYDGLIYGVT